MKTKILFLPLYVCVFACALLAVPIAARAQTDERQKDLVRADAALSAAQKRVALVIGNKDYAEAPLKNPVNDANAMAQTLRGLGFEVLLKTNLTKRQIREAVDEFTSKLGPNTIGLFYFSGHGVQINGINYLVPLAYHIERQADVEDEAYPASRLLASMGESGCPLNIVILDACRNNPLPKNARALGDKGLGKMDAPKGTFIAYATAPGQTASDDSDKNNGLYTGVLLEKMKTPGLSIEQVFKATRVSVDAASSGKQTPWEESSLQNDFYFAAGIPAPLPDPAPLPVPATRRINPKDGAELIPIPAGPFLMGDDDQKDNKRRTVTLPAYSIYKNPVTVKMYAAFCRETNRKMPKAPDYNPNWKNQNYPIVNVSWDDANAYCDWAGMALPTEAQWEKAARGTDGRTFPWGNTFDAGKLWRSKAALGDANTTVNVGSFPSGASPYGILDMAGNVSQWCADWSDGSKQAKVLRGGSMYAFAEVDFHCAVRVLGKATAYGYDWGFRCVSP